VAAAIVNWGMIGGLLYNKGLVCALCFHFCFHNAVEQDIIAGKRYFYLSEK